MSKLEALKFKMELQTKNLKLLTGYDRNKGISDSDNPKPVKRVNAVFKNQQIVRVEKDLERTSRQLQQELVIMQEFEGGKLLTPNLLTDIDGLFDAAESYFNYKQEQVQF